MTADDLKLHPYPTMGMSDWASVEPVSSTLAAQLAPRLSSQGTQIHHLTKEAFAQLRQELLEGKFSHLSLDDNATDVSRLVCIVLKAGLEPCMNDEKPDEVDLNGQLSDCLDIIKTAISKAPHTLTKFPDPEILGEKACAPLYVWLVVRLLHLSFVRCNGIVKEKITGIFSIIVRAQYKHTRLWSTCHVIPTFLRACVTGW
jgi:serine/threonine-protein kinase ATR